MHPLDREMRNLSLKRVETSLMPHELCDRCDGTGNQLYSMYQACEKCHGTGTVRL